MTYSIAINQHPDFPEPMVVENWPEKPNPQNFQNLSKAIYERQKLEALKKSSLLEEKNMPIGLIQSLARADGNHRKFKPGVYHIDPERWTVEKRWQYQALEDKWHNFSNDVFDIEQMKKEGFGVRQIALITPKVEQVPVYKEGWEKDWEKINFELQHQGGVNPHAYRLGWIDGMAFKKFSLYDESTQSITSDNTSASPVEKEKSVNGYSINLHKEGDGIIRIYNPEGHVHCMYPYHLEHEANVHLSRLNTSTSPVKTAEEVLKQFGSIDYLDELYEKSEVLKAMEEYANQFKAKE